MEPPAKPVNFCSESVLNVCLFESLESFERVFEAFICANQRVFVCPEMARKTQDAEIVELSGASARE